MNLKRIVVCGRLSGFFVSNEVLLPIDGKEKIFLRGIIL